MFKIILTFLVISSGLFAETTSSFRKAPKRPGAPHFARVQITVTDIDDETEMKIVYAEFDGAKIALRPSNPTGIRGKLHLQLFPGTYPIRWIVEKNDPRPIRESFEELIEIAPNEEWVDILIEGDQIEIR